jgi:hypothetical protein
MMANGAAVRRRCCCRPGPVYGGMCQSCALLGAAATRGCATDLASTLPHPGWWRFAAELLQNTLTGTRCSAAAVLQSATCVAPICCVSMYPAQCSSSVLIQARPSNLNAKFSLVTSSMTAKWVDWGRQTCTASCTTQVRCCKHVADAWGMPMSMTVCTVKGRACPRHLYCATTGAVGRQTWTAS